MDSKYICSLIFQNIIYFLIDLDDGLDYNSFKSGIYQVFVQSEEMSKRIFKTIDYNFSGFLNWSEFLQLMVQNPSPFPLLLSSFLSTSQFLFQLFSFPLHFAPSFSPPPFFFLPSFSQTK